MTKGKKDGQKRGRKGRVLTREGRWAERGREEGGPKEGVEDV